MVEAPMTSQIMLLSGGDEEEVLPSSLCRPLFREGGAVWVHGQRAPGGRVWAARVLGGDPT